MQLSSKKFWKKIRAIARSSSFIRQVLAMYFAMKDPHTPLAAKASLGAALAYFVMPLDAIPDVMAVIGYTDDIAVIAAAWQAYSWAVTREHCEQADEFLQSLD